MQVEQAVFTSARSRKSQGYHLVAVSPGIGDSLARTIATWGPSHASLLSDKAAAESVNFHPLDDDYFAISRSVHGGAEYSGRAGLQVFTRFLVVTRAQLAAYENHALNLAQTAAALGLLRLSLKLPSELPLVELPDRSIATVKPAPGECVVSIDSIRRRMALGTRVAVVGIDEPLPILAALLRDVCIPDRLAVSFSTGLRPSIDRSFQLQFAQCADSSVSKQFASLGIDQVSVAC